MLGLLWYDRVSGVCRSVFAIRFLVGVLVSDPIVDERFFLSCVPFPHAGRGEVCD